MYTPNEWTVIRQGLDLVTITGKNAKDLAALQVKVEKDIQKSTAKKEKELQKLVKKGEEGSEDKISNLIIELVNKNASGVFNVGTGSNTSVNELAAMISDNTIMIEPRLGESRLTLADNNKLKTVMGWSLTVKLSDWIANQTEKVS
mgnify:CR=1 FL=1